MEALSPTVELVMPPLRADLARTLAQLLADAADAIEDAPEMAGAHIRRAHGLLHAMLPAARASDQDRAARGGLAPWQAKLLKRHIADHLGERLDIPTLASLTRLSTGHFGRAFRTTFATSPHAYITECRVAQAKAMIEDGGESLADIAIACGLSDQAHLCHVFRRNTGMSPVAWRRLRKAPAVRPFATMP